MVTLLSGCPLGGWALSTGWRALRRRLLTPGVSATRLDVRGFHVKDQATRELLETIGASFLAGYGYAVEARTPLDAEAGLETVPTRFRGFAYEGAAMGFAVLDGLPLGGGGRVGRFLSGRAAGHAYMGDVGGRWADAPMAPVRRATLYPAG